MRRFFVFSHFEWSCLNDFTIFVVVVGGSVLSLRSMVISLNPANTFKYFDVQVGIAYSVVSEVQVLYNYNH